MFFLTLQIEDTEKAGELRTDGDSDTMVDSGLAYVHATRESIATTPVEGTSIIDIHKGFQVNKCTLTLIKVFRSV